MPLAGAAGFRGRGAGLAAALLLDGQLLRLLLALFFGQLQRDDFAGLEALLDFGAGVIGDAHFDVALLEGLALLHIDEALHLAGIRVLLGKHGRQRHGGHVVRRGDGDFDIGRHARADALVHVLEHDAGRVAFDVVLDDRLGRDALDGARRPQAGHGFDGDLDRLAHLEAGDIGLVDLGVDDHVVEVGDGEDFGAAVEAVGAGDRLADRNRAGQHRAIKGSADFRLGQVLISDRQRALGAFEGVLGQVVGGLGVVVEPPGK